MARVRRTKGVCVDRQYRGAVLLRGIELLHVDERCARVLDDIHEGWSTVDAHDPDGLAALAAAGVVEVES